MRNLSLLFLFFSWLCGWAQRYTSTLISLEEGLSQSSVHSICQDPQGFLWLGTEDGLNRYDGYGFKVFKHEPFDSASLADNQVSSLLADREGKIWVGLRLKGLSVYLPGADRFENFSHDPQDPHSLSSDNVTTLYQDLRGEIWVGTTHGFNRLQEKENGRLSFERYHVLTHPASEAYIRCFYEDNKGNFWVGTQSGLHLFDRLEKQLLKVDLLHGEEDASPKPYGSGVKCLVMGRDGALWVAMGKGLLRWEPEQNQATWIIRSTHPVVGEFFVSDLALNLNGDLLVTTMGEGLIEIPFDPESGAYRAEWRRFHTREEEAEISRSRIAVLHLDQLNPDILWLGHNVRGLEKLMRGASQFHTDHLDIQGLNTKFVSSLCKDGQGQLWIGTGNGLVRQSSDGARELVQPNPQDARSLTGNWVSHLAVDSAGKLWVGTREGLGSVQATPGKDIHFEHTGPKEPVWVIYPRDYLHLATRQGIGFLDPQKGEMLAPWVELPEKLTNGFGYQVYALLWDKKQRYWVGTSTGLVLYRDIKDPQRDLPLRQPEVYRHNPRDRSSIRSHHVLCAFEDAKGRIWLGTYHGLLQVQDEGDRLSFLSFSEQEGLANNVVYGILEDPLNGHLWLSTNGGLSRLDPERGAFENFDSRDGLQSNEFNSQAYYQDETGEMYFGGINGYTHFLPSEIIGDTIPPRVWITAMLGTDNQEHNLLRRSEKPVQLSYQQNSFALSFIALNYADPLRNRYAYQLEGLDEGWIPCGESRQVNFSKLPPGDYTFRVIAANGDGVWNRVGDAVQISISPPFWQTPWFYLLLLFVLFSGLYLFLHYRIQAKVKRVMELERVRKNAAADFHDELGHKLTIIALFGEIVKKKVQNQPEVIPQLNKIIENANSLYYSMKDLLWVLDPNKDSVYDLVLLLKDFGDELFDKTGVAFRTQGISETMKDRVLPMDHKRHIALIFKEAMNNTLKHAQCANAVLSVELSGEGLRLVFKDDGQGFDISQPPRGGNGLQNLRARAARIDADLKLASGPEGTSVSLSCRNK